MRIPQSKLKPMRENAKVSLLTLSKTLSVPPDYLLAVEKQNIPANDRIKAAYIQHFAKPGDAKFGRYAYLLGES